ncbi:TH1 protein [Seminavis robusta]|uniref:TH1 protein n=1 Tax=Seminavis robusta TaxID=568900 RepID=A0A9N8EEB7_9STRA|nr:TH1 protein [Seminavis robusta]|eukprot:Sro814_g206400.1 TH1 protein (1168) ;mRNA; f:40376-44111
MANQWEKHQTDEGETYYYNPETEETTWEKPDGFQEEDGDDNNDPAEESGNNNDGVWEKHYDEDEKKHYYSNTKTNETTWEKPDGFKEDDDAQEEEKPDDDGERKPTSKSGVWEKHEDADGSAYYYNTETEETSWEKPEGFVDDDDDKKDHQTDKQAVKEEEEEAERMEEEALPKSPIGGVEEEALPKSPIGGADDDDDDNDNDEQTQSAGTWERHEDEEGREYYYNPKTDETTWDRPPGFQESTKEDDDNDNDDDAAVKEEEEEEKPEGQWEKLTDDEGREYYYNATTDVTQWDKPDDFIEGAAKPTSPKPAKKASGWEKLTDEEGREYYYNAETDVTQWDKPDDYEEDEGKGEPPKPSKSSSGWEKLTDEEGREYYYNATTDVTQWEKPDDYDEGSSSSPKPSKSSSGWEKLTDDEGRAYYYNETTGDTQWDAPEGFDDQDEKKADEDDEFQASPKREPSPMSVEEEAEKEPEPEPEPEIDPVVKRVMDAEAALNKPDSVLEPGCTSNVLEVVASQDGNPEKAIVALIDNFQGQTAICGTIARWLADLRSASSDTSDVNELVGKAKHSVADGIRETAQDVVSRIAKERFSNAVGDDILSLSKSDVAFLEEMIESNRWRKLLIELASTHKESALLMYCIRTISKRGYHRELVKRMNPSEYFSVFNSMLQSELTIVGKTAISAANDVDTSIGLEELVSDLHRTCTATAFTYLYSLEVLRHLVTEAEEDSAAEPGSRMRRAIRKWERLSEDLDTAMVDPSTSSATAGSSTIFRKRRLDVALTVSEIHQRQRRRLKPSSDEDEAIPFSNGNDQTKKLESGLEQFLRRFSVGQQANDSDLDVLLPTGLNMQSAKDEVGHLFVTYPLSIRALLSNIFKTSGTIGKSIRSKCSTLLAVAILASEKRARAEIGQEEPDPESPDEVALTSTIKRASELCEELATMASFVVTSTGTERGALSSPGQHLCNLALKCATVAQGVLMWAKDIISGSEYTSSATFSTFSPSILTLVRIVSSKHPCTRKEAADIAFTFLRHNVSSEISYKKINDIREQSLRLLLFLVVHGEAPSILRTLTILLGKGEAIKLDPSLMRYLISGMIEVVRPPFSLPFVRLFGGLLKTPRCMDAVRTRYFGDEKRKRLTTMLSDFKRSCITHKGRNQDVALVAHLMKTYAIKSN